MSEVLVIGHRNPDTDSICSAIAYAEFKQRTGMPEAIAARCGDTNDRTDFVLRTFHVPPPKFVSDVSAKARDVMQRQVISLRPTDTVAEALGLMDDRNFRVVPVLDEGQRCLGLISVFKVSKFFFPGPYRLFDSRRVWAPLDSLQRTLSAKVLHAIDTARDEDLILMVGAMKADSFSERLGKYPAEQLIVLVGDRPEIQELAIRSKVRAIVITGGLPIEDDLVAAAKSEGVSVLVSPHDTATTAMLARAAIRVEHMIDTEFLSFREDESLWQIQKTAAGSPFQAFPVLDSEGRTVGILSKSDFLKPVSRRLILVDHNELSQAVRGADQVEILEVLDHHRIGLSTAQPIAFRNEPVGSTSTIVAERFLQEGVELSRQTAGLLLAGLVSDTLNLSSPTTTDRDRAILKKLEARAEVNAGEFTQRLFASGSVLTSRSTAQAIESDCKRYDEQGRRFAIAQIEEIGFVEFWKRQEEVQSALATFRGASRLDFAALLVTDVVRQTSLLVLDGESSLLRQIGYPEVKPRIFQLDGIVSRKKQLLPYLTHCLAHSTQ